MTRISISNTNSSTNNKFLVYFDFNKDKQIDRPLFLSILFLVTTGNEQTNKLRHQSTMG